MNRYDYAAGKKLSCEDFMDTKIREWNKQYFLSEEERIINEIAEATGQTVEEITGEQMKYLLRSLSNLNRMAG